MSKHRHECHAAGTEVLKLDLLDRVERLALNCQKLNAGDRGSCLDVRQAKKQVVERLAAQPSRDGRKAGHLGSQNERHVANP
ncbi:hypothetical protein D3C73_504430 [compost metagenome]